ncbi:MAG TPA: glycosyltransferase [Candidatus Hydrogenedentes bacterium]|nr:glycosyltransferase [Candidatus Hydrogenedentota bacterium]HPG68632.1 glycosyltransferase [Candidatus Hydrogenedentota bacterium]
MSASNSELDPVVSVVTATHAGDALEHVHEAVESVLGQRFERFELIVVLDGPVAPATREWLAQRSAEDARLRVCALASNAGAARARNAGIAEARGEYVAILDADDVATPDRLDRQVAFARETGADVVGSFYRVVRNDGSRFVKEVPLSEGAIRRALCLFNPIANSTVLARRDVIRKHPYPEAPHSSGPCFDGEDYALWVDLARRGYRLRNQPECLVDFREGPDFMGRRRGLGPFRTDLASKLDALVLWPVLWRPLGLLACAATALVRLLPRSLIAAAYAFRNRLRFRW